LRRQLAGAALAQKKLMRQLGGAALATKEIDAATLAALYLPKKI
jgi:hypothetical protein